MQQHRQLPSYCHHRSLLRILAATQGQLPTPPLQIRIRPAPQNTVRPSCTNSCPLNKRLNHGECVPTSIATRHRRIPANIRLMAPWLVDTLPSDNRAKSSLRDATVRERFNGVTLR